MSVRHVLGTALAAATLLAGCGVVPSAGPRTTIVGDMGASAIPGEILVGLKAGRSKQAMAGLTQKLGLRTVGSIGALGIHVVTTGTGTAKALEELRKQPDVAFAEPNAREVLPPMKKEGPVRKGGAPSRGGDPMLGDQWGMATIHATEAWAATAGDPKTVLAIVDTGIDYNHPEFAGRMVPGHDFANDDSDPMDGHSHGTHCAGIAAASANNGHGGAGVAPNVSLMAVKVLSDQGSGSTDDVCAGIVWAADHGAHVISMSLGGTGGQQAKQAAVDYARSKGAVVVVAMGNNGGNVAVYPGANKGVIAVGATTLEETRASFSNFGDWIGVSAPGHKILSTVPNNGYQAYSGTSMATPFVAGLASLIRSQDPSLDAEAVRARIEKGSVDLGKAGFDPEFGHGRIDAAAALKR